MHKRKSICYEYNLKKFNNLRADVKLHVRLPVKQLILLFWPNVPLDTNLQGLP